MELDAGFFAFAVPAVLLAALSKGGFGGGMAFIAAPLLALAVEPRLAVGLMLPLLMLMDVTSLRPYWRRWSWPHARRLMLGAVPGVALGAVFFGAVSADAIRFLIGAVAIGFVLFQLALRLGWAPVPAEPPGPRKGLFWGGVAGFTSFVSHAGGPPAMMYLLGNRLSKTSYQATTVLVFWWINLIKFPPYLALGMFTSETALAGLILTPVAVAGVLIGVWTHRMMPEGGFFALTYALLMAAGCKLVYDAVT
jgi:uncharacterized protein